jgi:hypothetical protein
MADPKELQEAADAILQVRRLPAVQRHQELAEPLQLAEEWARNLYRKVTEQPADPDPAQAETSPSATRSSRPV